MILSETPMYNEAMKLCWNTESYKFQVAVVIELLKLQQSSQIPPEVTSEDIMNLLLKESKRELRGCVFNFEHDGLNGGDGMPLFMLIWKVNTGNKIRDIMLEAKMLFMLPWALHPNFQNPEVISKVQDYAKILREKSEEASSSRLFSPQQVVEEIVPRVLQIIWVFPLCPCLDMPSQDISTKSVALTLTASRNISRALRGGEQVTLPQPIKDDMVLSILLEIRQLYPLPVLLKKIKDSTPQFLVDIIDVAVGQICQLFMLRRVAASSTPSVESPATSEDDIDRVVREEEPSPISERDCFVAVVRPSPFEHTPFAPPPSPSEPPSSPLPAPPSEPLPFSPPTPHAEPPSFSEIQASEEVNEESIQENPPNSRRRTRKRKTFFQKLCCCFADCGADTE